MSLTCCENTHVTELWERFGPVARALKGLTLGHMAISTQASISHTRGSWAIFSQACVTYWLSYSKRSAHAHRSACAKTGFSALQTLSIKHDWCYNTWPLLTCILSVWVIDDIFIALDRRLLVTPHLTGRSSDSSNISRWLSCQVLIALEALVPFWLKSCKSPRQHREPAVIFEPFCLHGVQLKGVAGQQ